MKSKTWQLVVSSGLALSFFTGGALTCLSTISIKALEELKLTSCRYVKILNRDVVKLASFWMCNE